MGDGAEDNPSGSDLPVEPASTLKTDSTLVRRPDNSESKIIEQLFGMQVQSGPAAMLATFASLPEPIQKQQLANDANRDKMAFDLEAKRIEAAHRESDSQRAHQLALREQERRRDDKNDTRAFWFVVGISAFTAAITVVLFLQGEHKIAVPILTGLGGAGLGFQSGKGSGYTKAKRELEAEEASRRERDPDLDP